MSEEILISKIQNFPIDSNCYIITNDIGKECILVDPALEKGASLYSNLLQKGLMLEYIILTHEHFDHISSVEYLRDNYECRVISSAICSEYITNPRKNLSIFYDQIGFSCSPADIIIIDDYVSLQWGETIIKFYSTPGHSEGGICFSIGNNLFTGDTIIRDVKPVVKLPGGNKADLDKSLKRLFEMFDGDTVIFPGHGEIFKLSELDYKYYSND
jgi:hydroxyacylglutathione hydrolase